VKRILLLAFLTCSLHAEDDTATWTNLAASIQARAAGGRYHWHVNIGCTIFWIGESPSAHDPGNRASSYNSRWLADYGGADSPTDRAGYLPARFVPRLNPFYVALPVQDVLNGHTLPQAAKWIPWFRQRFRRDGESVLYGRWVAIKHGNRTAYAQLADCGPYHVDDWNYCFGNARPALHANNDAGIDCSPSVRDYLNLSPLDRVDWKFVSDQQVPRGPWIAATFAKR
jgi:hypothetical protein